MKKGLSILFVLLIYLLPTMLFAWPIPDTGQTKCYNNMAEIPCPNAGEAFYGQDSQYNINPPSYTKLDAEGNALPDDASSWVMVRDNVTGLIWEIKQDMDETQNYSNPHDSDNLYFWYDSNPATNGGYAGTPGEGTDTEDFINALNVSKFGGYSDWRMPTIHEIFSIIIKNLAPGPTVLSSYFPNTKPEQYWSSTTSPFSSSYTEVLDFYCGQICSYSGTGYKPGIHYARAVRGGVAAPHFIDNNDGTVTDINTGLTWQQATAPGTYTWEQALAYCETLTLASYDDWRLPTLKEFQSLVDYTRGNPTIDTSVFFNTASAPYVSSTSCDGNTVCVKGFVIGEDGCSSKDPSIYFYIRAVRGQSNNVCYSQEQLDAAVATERSKWNANGDGKIGLEEPIRALQVVCGIQ